VTEGDISFVSIGTNDLTQLMYGFSRDDTAKFMPDYLRSHILAADPFVTLDVRGVGSMVRLVVNKCRRANPSGRGKYLILTRILPLLSYIHFFCDIFY
jgi:phosphoenolpyruvate synthase/pyruvate phosphate dikinase